MELEGNEPLPHAKPSKEPRADGRAKYEMQNLELVGENTGADLYGEVVLGQDLDKPKDFFGGAGWRHCTKWRKDQHAE